ncbi:ABC transporter ATP-binding protein [Antarcticirhabdus aurantiaca]|uniref:ABC transporter ATP-binding protein n=1 Tax=Antarcticirhabdus aurantiaca TaxID=2606717 RepID=A0ACD4NNE3_9HYPH|nr:ABC transporter ATP-binding protein [Antarcticirhabdus aurantiaca]WAJ28376.1 ABC transporter ATP-binding protein [Jeongeuplla avenae]
MFEARSISVRYGKHLALDDVSLEVGTSECVAILGANGAGKSSLLRGLTQAGLRERGGVIRHRGEDISATNDFDLVEKGIALVPEGRGVFAELTVDDNLSLGAHPKRARESASERRAEVLDLFPKLGQRLAQTVGTMSGGEQQMVAVARALMSRPTLLLLDEPSLGLAPIVVDEMFAALHKVRDSGVSILIVEQNVRASLALAARGYVLEAGRIVGRGSSAELVADPMVAKAFLGH